MEDFLKKAGDVLISSGLKLMLACLILIIGFKLVKFLLARISKRRGFQRIDPSAQTFIKSFLNIGAKILIVITAAAIMGVPMTSIAAAIASAGLAIGLALQGGLSNLAGGVLLLIFKPFAIGDYIKTENGLEGTVVKIDIFYTTLKMADNTKIVIPNGTLSNELYVYLFSLRHKTCGAEIQRRIPERCGSGAFHSQSDGRPAQSCSQRARPSVCRACLARRQRAELRAARLVPAGGLLDGLLRSLRRNQKGI